MQKPMLQQLRLFLTAVQFFTRIPVPAWVGHSPLQLDQSVRYFPLVGVVVGVYAAAVLCLTAWVLPLTLAVVLSMLASILITGAFHEDGLSDFVDGMGGGYTREKMLAIMKDSHVGAYGVIAIVLALMVKFLALLELANKHSLMFMAATLVAAHGISRLLAVSIMMAQKYVRDDDTARAKPVAQGLSRSSFAVAILTGFVAVALLLVAGAAMMNIFTALTCVLVLRVYLGRKLRQQLGGYTGDCLGAVQQITEIGFYLGLLLSW
jgi:adenosylcobinamide-GDP ribazoletransferase